MAVDAFLTLTDMQGNPIHGESQDAVFGKVHAIEIFDFDFEASKNVEVEPDDEPPPSFADDDADSFFASLAGAGDLYRDTAHDSFSFSIKKMLDLSTPHLYHSFCQTLQKNRKKVKFTFAEAKVYLCVAGVKRDSSKKPEDVAYMVLHFEDLYVTKYALKLDTGLNIPDEDIDFFFQKYKMGYRPQASAGGFATKLRYLGFDFVDDKKL